MNHRLYKNSLIIQALAYFDIFNHPLTIEEIANLSDHSSSETLEFLNSLENQQVCFKRKNYYSLQQSTDLITARLDKEQKALNYLKKLPFYAKLISSFPYVRSIAVSGSLSKGVMHEDGDIDYFIITVPNRMWNSKVHKCTCHSYHWCCI